jgi:hypothetical protein
MFENKVPDKISRPESDELSEQFSKRHKKKLCAV